MKQPVNVLDRFTLFTNDDDDDSNGTGDGAVGLFGDAVVIADVDLGGDEDDDDDDIVCL